MIDWLMDIKIWIRNNYNRIVGSIAFYPALISLLFLGLSVLMISFDFSDSGKGLKSDLHWLSLQDASTARNIIVVIAGGIISLTVFSFSMVMIVLNQAASNMSNRVLNKLIGNRFQQIVLGIYIGTIMYALFLLSTIREIDSGIYVPAISTYLLIIIAVIDIFLFIYFLHYITQSVKYNVIIEKVTQDTKRTLKSSCTLKRDDLESPPAMLYSIKAPASGIYRGVELEKLADIGKQHKCTFNILYPEGEYVLEGTALIMHDVKLDDETSANIKSLIYIGDTETIQENFIYGFKQLTEIALRALSPGVNDPGTASLALRALFDLFSYRICFFPERVIRNDNNVPVIYIAQHDFDTIFETSVLPVWDYGKGDRILRNELHRLLQQFVSLHKNEKIESLFKDVASSIK